MSFEVVSAQFSEDEEHATPANVTASPLRPGADDARGHDTRGRKRQTSRAGYKDHRRSGALGGECVHRTTPHKSPGDGHDYSSISKDSGRREGRGACHLVPPRDRNAMGGHDARTGDGNGEDAHRFLTVVRPIGECDCSRRDPDPESKVMSTSNGFLQGFNAQAVANAEQLVVAAEVTDEQNDARQFDPLIEATQASLDDAGITARPEKLVAGYASEENFAALGEDDPDPYVATRNMKNNPAACIGRRVPLRKDAKLVERMDRKVPNKAGRALYRHRQQLIEPVFGQIKDARHIRGFGGGAKRPPTRSGRSSAAPITF